MLLALLSAAHQLACEEQPYMPLFKVGGGGAGGGGKGAGGMLAPSPGCMRFMMTT